MTDRELMQQALDALENHATQRTFAGGVYIANAAIALRERLAQPEQEPVAYDKTEINCFAQDLYDQKMREGKRGHYESMFHVIHQCIKKVSPRAQRTWVGLKDEEISEIAINNPPMGHGARGTATQTKGEEHMTKDDIIRMAREAGGGTTWWPLHTNTLERLVELVRAAEREECAKVCESTAWTSSIEEWRDMTKKDVASKSMLVCADAIRARGNT